MGGVHSRRGAVQAGHELGKQSGQPACLGGDGQDVDVQPGLVEQAAVHEPAVGGVVVGQIGHGQRLRLQPRGRGVEEFLARPAGGAVPGGVVGAGTGPRGGVLERVGRAEDGDGDAFVGHVGQLAAGQPGVPGRGRAALGVAVLPVGRGGAAAGGGVRAAGVDGVFEQAFAAAGEPGGEVAAGAKQEQG